MNLLCWQILCLAVQFLLVRCTAAEYPSGFRGANLTTIVSPVDSRITVRYTVPTGACKTAFDNQKQYTGWVSVPGDYETNLFFWFVGARQPTSLLTIWLNGGPGSSSMFGFFTETGPCEVVERGANRIETVAREWGWDRASNMLFIDQPNQVGFSYDSFTNATVDVVTGNVYVAPQKPPSSRPPHALFPGTFGSGNANHAPNTTETAAMAIWHMLQGFLSVFPQYNPPDRGSLGVNLFAESYGGKYGPVFAEKWAQQNLKRQLGLIPAASTVDIHLASLGIVNGCIDDLIQGPYYPQMATHNPYGLTAINSVRASLANASFYAPSGCQDLIKQCRAAVALYDPDNKGAVPNVNGLCQAAYDSCMNNVVLPYTDAGRSAYDIAHGVPDSFPPSTYIEYINTVEFQAAIGAPLNYTETNFVVNRAFYLTGDYERTAMVPKLAALLNSGVRIGLMYGDRDYICNWLGGEAVSLALAAEAGGLYASRFARAGYAPIIVNESYIGGVVRQLGNLSFSRIYQAGHSMPAYQPETAFQVFARIILGTSVSTGEAISLAYYNTSGPISATQSLSLPPRPRQTCWIRNMPYSCTDEQKNMFLAGKGVIINGALYAASSDWAGFAQPTIPPSTATNPGGSGSGGRRTTSLPLTGLFTATTTPSSGAVPSGRGAGAGGDVILMVITLVLAASVGSILVVL